MKNGLKSRFFERRGVQRSDWCASHGITKANYYYRLRRVRQVCLENLSPETPAQQIVPVTPCLLHQETQDDTDARLGLSVSVNSLSIHATESTPMPLLAAALKVVRDAGPMPGGGLTRQ